MKKKQRSHLEERFLQMWNACDGYSLEREVRVCDYRKFRFDFAHIPTRTAIEIEGGTWVMGGHSTGAGIARDCEKSFIAITEGWTMFRLTKEMIDISHIEKIIRWITKRHFIKEITCQTS